jgi:hypothetical protein
MLDMTKLMYDPTPYTWDIKTACAMWSHVQDTFRSLGNSSSGEERADAAEYIESIDIDRVNFPTRALMRVALDEIPSASDMIPMHTVEVIEGTRPLNRTFHVHEEPRLPNPLYLEMNIVA